MSTLTEMVVTGGEWCPPRLLIYAPEKFGKTSTAAQGPRPLFLGTDDGRRRLGADGLPIAADWPTFLAQLQVAVENAKTDGYESIVIDTMNGVVNLCAEWVCLRQFGGKWNDPKHGFLAWGGNQGWGSVAEEVKPMLALLDQAIDSGLWVIMLAHETYVTIKNPIEGDYQQVRPDIDRRPLARILQWADVNLHGDFDVHMIEDGTGRRRAKADPNRRLLHSVGTPARAAGCRVGYELPPVIAFDWQTIEQALGQPDDELAERVRVAMQTLDDVERSETLAWLGVADTGKLAQAPQHKLAQVVNRFAERANTPEKDQT